MLCTSASRMEEKQSIKDSLRCLKKYGSVSNNNYNKYPSRFLKHMVTKSETLQGIALKYDVTTEEIRRANKLWANDSLFLRESLLIPMKNGVVSPSTSSSIIEGSLEPDLFVNQNLEYIANDSNHCLSRSNSFRSSSSSQRIDDDLDSYNDFLSRIDADIANKRQQLKISQDKSLFAEEGNIVYNGRKKPALSRLKQQQQQSSRQFDNNNWRPSSFQTPDVTTHTNKTRSSLSSSRDVDDRIFEL